MGVIDMTTLETIKEQIAANTILLYMKGSPRAPQCGFSSQVVEILIQCDKPFAFVDVLAHPEIRTELPKFAQWPTFPQLWVKGELVGGCDIVMDLFKQGALKPMIETAVDAVSEDTDAMSASSN